MNYRHIYMCIVMHAKSEMKLGLRPKNKFKSEKSKFSNQYFEFHHILPKSLFPKWAKRNSNLVALTAREHFFCHQLLTKIWSSKQMTYALFAMTLDKHGHRENRLTSKEYEKLKKNYRELLSKIPRTAEWRYAISKANLGKKMSKEACQKMSQAKKGKTSNRKGIKLSDETKRKISESCSHHQSWNKGKQTPNSTKEKIRKALTGRKRPERIVYYKCVEDNFIGSINELCKRYNLSLCTIPRCIKTKVGYVKKVEKHFIRIG